MKIIPNYNLSFNQKVNQQQTNPTFGINQKMISSVSLGIGTAAGIGAVIEKLMPVRSDIAIAIQNGPVTQKQVKKLRNLPVNKLGYTRLHYLCQKGKLEDIKEFLEKNPDINLNQ